MAFVLFTLVSYSLSIKKTLNLRSQCHELEVQISDASFASEKIAKIEGRLKSLNELIGTNITSDLDFQELLLETVTGYCSSNHIILKELPRTHSFIDQEYLVETNVIVVEGSYIKLLKLIYMLEKQFKLCKIISVKFESEEDLLSKRIRLFATIYFQNIKNRTNETGNL